MTGKHQIEKLGLYDRVDRVGQHIVRARLFLDLWFYFEEKHSRQKLLPTMTTYNEFFRFTPHAYLVSFVVYISGAFETRNDTINLGSLYKELKKTNHLKLNIADIDKLLAEAKPLVAKVKILRDKAFAHQSAMTSYNSVFTLAEITYAQLRELTETALKIANYLLLACELPEQHFTPLPVEHAKEMMLTLTEAAIGVN